MEKTKIRCTTCPFGCEIEVLQNDDGSIEKITGNACKRGEAYAECEVTDPRRTLTSTVKIIAEFESRMPVKTDKPIAKKNFFTAMEIIKNIEISAPCRAGDIIYPDFTEKNISLIAGKDILS